MASPRKVRWWIAATGGLAVVAVGAALLLAARDPDTKRPPSERRQSTVTVQRRDFVRSIRLTGTVEAIQANTVSVPRLQGQGTTTMSLVITYLIRPGSMVKPGDLRSSREILEDLLKALDVHTEGKPFVDDATLIVLQRLP